jgi:hypothetical protein
MLDIQDSESVFKGKWGGHILVSNDIFWSSTVKQLNPVHQLSHRIFFLTFEFVDSTLTFWVDPAMLCREKSAKNSTKRLFGSKGHFPPRINSRSHEMQYWIKMCSEKKCARNRRACCGLAQDKRNWICKALDRNGRYRLTVLLIILKINLQEIR